MTILATELVWRRAAENSDLDTNGGAITATAIPNSVKNNMFPDISQSERANGLTRYRKTAIHVANDSDLALLNAKVFVETVTPGEDYVTFFPAEGIDTQADIVGDEREYGGGRLNASVAIGATSIQVMVENGAIPIFQDGDLIRISNKATVSSETGTTEYATVTGAPSVNGDVVTLTLTEGVANGYSNANTRVASVYIAPARIEAEATAPVVTSATGGAYSGSVQADGIGSIAEDWTLTFTSPTAFIISGATKGQVGTGSTLSTTSPANPNFSKPYWTLSPAGFSGTFAINDTITFTTTPAHLPLWYKQVVPAGSASITGNNFILGVEAESE